MHEDDGYDGPPDRRPFDERTGDDLFVWDDLPTTASPAEEALGGGGRRVPPSRHRADADRPSSRRPSGAPVPARPGDRSRDPASRPGAHGADDEWTDWLDPGEGAQAGGPAAGDGPGGPFGPDALGHLPERLRPRRRRLSAGAVLAAMLLGFFIAGLLTASAIDKQVEGEPLGAARSVQLALLRPIVALSGALQLDRPAAALDALLGRGTEKHHRLAETKAKKPKWPRHITRHDPLRLWIIGDSMAQVFGTSLKSLAEDTHLIKAKVDYKVSSGLSRPDFFDWPQHMIDQLVEFDPDATAVLFGANDGQDFVYQGRTVHLGTRSWQAAYAKRVGAAMDILTRGGRRVYWVGNPTMRDAAYRDRIAMMDHIYATEARKHPGVIYISTWALFSGKKGSYAEYLPGPGGDLVLMRAPDGIHLTRAGGDRMARIVLGVIEKDWGMPQQP